METACIPDDIFMLALLLAGGHVTSAVAISRL
jgi:hypothetical protein